MSATWLTFFSLLIMENERKILWLTVLQHWRTRIPLNINSQFLTTNEIPIQRKIYQRNSCKLTLILSCVNRLSRMLSNTGFDFKIIGNANLAHTILQFLHIDGIKLYVGFPEKITELIITTSTFPGNIHMEFEREKCKIQNIQKIKF